MAETTTRKTLREAVAGDLRQFFASTIQAVSSVSITIDAMRDFAPDKYRIRDGYLYLSLNGQWRPVVTFDPDTGIVTINRAYSPAPSVTDAVQWYGALEPPAWDNIIDEALQETPHRERYTTALVADTWSYALPTWVISKDQVLAVKLRLTPSGERPREFPVRHIVQETANVITVELATLTDNVTDYTLVVETKRYFTALASDAATTTCPLQLARAIVAETAAQRILHELGGEAKQVFGVSMGLLREKAAAARMRLLPHTTQRDYSIDHNEPIGPVPVMSSGWDWEG